MAFTHDTDVALQYAAVLVNTRPTAAHPEGLPSVEVLRRHLLEWDWTGRPPEHECELQAVRRLRERLRDY